MKMRYKVYCHVCEKHLFDYAELPKIGDPVDPNKGRLPDGSTPAFGSRIFDCNHSDTGLVDLLWIDKDWEPGAMDHSSTNVRLIWRIYP